MVEVKLLRILMDKGPQKKLVGITTISPAKPHSEKIGFETCLLRFGPS